MGMIISGYSGYSGYSGFSGISGYSGYSGFLMDDVFITLKKHYDHDIYDVIAKYNVLCTKNHYYISRTLNHNNENIFLNCRFIFIMTVGIKI